MKKVIVESPYGAKDEQTLARNRQYARAACHDCVKRGENPFASHLFYTQFLDDRDPVERTLGIDMGFARWDDAEAIVFYLDLGLSPGMQKALQRAFELGLQIERRFLKQAFQPDAILPGPTIENAMKEFVESAQQASQQQVGNAQDSDTRTDRREDSNTAGVGQGVDLQRT